LFVKGERFGSQSSSDGEDAHDEPDPVDQYVDLSYYTGEYHDADGAGNLGHEGHVLDLTNFDGDNDEHMLGEAKMNHTVKKQGRLRRAFSRRAQASGSKVPPPYVSEDSPSYAASLDAVDLKDHRQGPETHKVPSSSSALPRHLEASRRAPLAVSIPESQSSFASPYQPQSAISTETDRRLSVHSLARLWMPHVGTGASGQQVELHVDGQEMQDVSVMSEFARPGRPKLDVILRDEVSRSDGPVVVACEFPTGVMRC